MVQFKNRLQALNTYPGHGIKQTENNEPVKEHFYVLKIYHLLIYSPVQAVETFTEA